MSWHNLKNLALENHRVLLRRITLTDREQFACIAFDPDIWRHFVYCINSQQDLDQYIEEAIRDSLNGTRMVFAIIESASNRILGSTAFSNMVEKDLKLEIGGSWLAKEAWRTGINRAAKFALLDHAFDVLKCERVEFKTDVLNTQSRRALAGIGATEEGVLRSFNFMPDGRRRDAIYYSILRSEWKDVRVNCFDQTLT